MLRSGLVLPIGHTRNWRRDLISEFVIFMINCTFLNCSFPQNWWYQYLQFGRNLVPYELVPVPKTPPVTPLWRGKLMFWMCLNDAVEMEFCGRYEIEQRSVLFLRNEDRNCLRLPQGYTQHVLIPGIHPNPNPSPNPRSVKEIFRQPKIFNHSSFIATQRYQLISYLDTCKWTWNLLKQISSWFWKLFLVFENF